MSNKLGGTYLVNYVATTRVALPWSDSRRHMGVIRNTSLGIMVEMRARENAVFGFSQIHDWNVWRVYVRITPLEWLWQLHTHFQCKPGGPVCCAGMSRVCVFCISTNSKSSECTFLATNLTKIYAHTLSVKSQGISASWNEHSYSSTTHAQNRWKIIH